MGRPPVALGIWNAMITAAGTVEALAEVVGLSRQNLHLTFTALRNLSGPSRMLALTFAREHGVTARLYIHPSRRGAFLVSAADGWFALERGRSWAERIPCTRSEQEDWSHLSQLELPFVQLGQLLRQDDKARYFAGAE